MSALIAALVSRFTEEQMGVVGGDRLCDGGRMRAGVRRGCGAGCCGALTTKSRPQASSFCFERVSSGGISSEQSQPLNLLLRLLPLARRL